MRRTTTRRRRAMADFMADNRRLFPFVGLLLAGVIVGVTVYTVGGHRITDDWGALVRVSGLDGSFRAAFGAFWSDSFGTLSLLVVLFLLGLWPCGAPFAALIPAFYGLSLGLTEAYYYSLGGVGVGAVAAVMMPTGLLIGALLIMAGVESFRMSVTLSRCLLPQEEPHGEGLWPTFRLYCLRFLIITAAALGAGLLHVLLRMVFASLLNGL